MMIKIATIIITINAINDAVGVNPTNAIYVGIEKVYFCIYG